MPPWPETWSTERKVGFGFVAMIPLALLVVTFLCFLLSTFGSRHAEEALPVLFYTHVGAQFITLLIYGNLMIANPALGPTGKMLWGIAFLFLAPFAIATYYVMHVLHPMWPPPPSALPRHGPQRRVHVYDFDYSEHRAHGTQRREDGVLVHHIDVTTA